MRKKSAKANMLILRMFALTTLGAALLVPASAQESENNKISEDFWKELSKLKTMKEVKDKFLSEDKKIRYLLDDILEARSMLNEPRRDESSNDNLPPFPCQPLDDVVSVPVLLDPSFIRLPKCVVLRRCGGCCQTEGSTGLTECLPTKSRKIGIEVFNMNPSVPGYNITREIIQMEDHTECECSCSITDSHCNSTTHSFDKDHCKCRCINPTANCALPKQWNERLCRCHCPIIPDCLEDEVFSFESCSCKRQALQNRREVMDDVEVCASENCSPGYKAVEMSGRCLCHPISVRDWISDFAFSNRRR